MTGVQASEIEFWATNILDEMRGEARKMEIQCPSLLPVTSVPVPDEVLDSKRSLIDKILQSQQALALYNFGISEGMLAHLCEQQEDNLAIDILSQMIHNLRDAERTHFSRARNENGTNTNYFNLVANSIISHLNSEAGSHMLGAQVIARSDMANKDAVGITNLLFGIQQLGKARVKTKRFRPLIPSAIWKQVMRPMLNQNENQALGQNQGIQIRRTHDDMPPPNSGRRDQPPPGHGLYVQRNAAIPQSTIFPPALNAEQEILGIANVLTKETIKDHMHIWILKGFDLIPVSKDDEGQYWPGFGPGVLHAADWRKPKQQGQHLHQMKLKRSGKNTTLIQEWQVQRKSMTQKTTQRHYNQPKQQNKNLEINLEDRDIDLYHRMTRNQDMIPMTEEVNRENEQDQEVIRD
ncbi:MAG: hypothetical protein EZS28_001299 [Streblomastix strix]|uniref:Uncharacterized protein n=1 Tax=Streblomastix strix TaxID=222440 RepID=A0A5J4X811_9EUKA|nr:MAG: hypothetical protein EZS28_001299 [Streblomastix strix]